MYARSVGDTSLTLIVSGKLWRNSLIMMDEETGTLWSHVTGEAMEGPLAGRRLATSPSVQTTWAEWRAAHPGTRVLKKSEEILSSRYQRYFDDPERTGLFRTFWLQDRMPGKAKIHGVVRGPHAVAVADAALVPGEPRTFELGEAQVTMTRDADGGVRAVTSTGEDLLVRTAYWFAWSSFYPNTAVVD